MTDNDPTGKDTTEQGRPESEGVHETERRAAEAGAMAVDSPPQGVLRDDPDDPAGGDTGAASSTEAPHPVDSDVDPHDESVGRGADGDTESRLEQQEHGGP